MRLINHFITSTPLVVFAVLPLSLSAVTIKQGVELANSIGLQSGKLYCSGKSARESIEKGTAKAMSEATLSMDEINSVDFAQDVYSVPMIESLYSYTIDNCPARAKRLWREINETM
ncbi:hypothetical protein [Synechococcus sp. MIT S9503]|uniref:hypothetical protein n=1 Tax=Synechococcus sp. MIT S9503 TaxID=3082547 RepID=UPI0039A6940B